MERIKEWFLRYWKWLIFPVGLLGLLLGLAGSCIPRRPKPSSPLPAKTREALDKLRTADERRDTRLIELEQRHEAKLRELSEQQLEELETLRDAPLERVVQWFDTL